MTTAHVSVALLDGPPPTKAELLAGLTWVLQRHPMLAACVRGKSKFHVADAAEYPLHSDYLGKAVEYTKELLRIYPDDDIQRFEPPRPADELARRALSVVQLDDAPLEAVARGLPRGNGRPGDGRGGRRPALATDALHVGGGAPRPALVYAANHAIPTSAPSISFLWSWKVPRSVPARSRRRRWRRRCHPGEGALLGKEQRQSEEIKGA